MDTTSEAKPTPPPPELRDLERLIEFEIKQRDDQERAQGWTPWLLVVAICALLWRFVESTEKQNWPAVGLFWATTILLIDMAKSLGIWFTIEGSATEPKPRYFAANWLLRGSRGHLVLVGTKLIGATVLVFFLAPLPETLRWLWFAFVVISAAETPVVLLLSYSDYGIKPPNPVTYPVFRVGLLVRWAMMSAATVLLAILWWNCLDMSLTRESMKTALLVVGIAEVATLWSELKSGSVFRDSLLQLRRAIGLGGLTVEDAKRRIDEVLHGAETPQFLAKNIKVFDQALADFSTAQVAAHAALVAAKTLIASPTYSPAAASSALAELKAKIATARNLFDAVTKARQRALLRAAIVVGQAPNEMAFVKGLTQRLETGATAAEKSHAELMTEVAQVEVILSPPAAEGPPII